MSGRWERRLAVAVTSAVLCGGIAADDEAPDAAFLEYLGSWEGSDEDWMLFDDDEDADSRERAAQSEPVRPEEEPREQNDEN